MYEDNSSVYGTETILSDKKNYQFDNSNHFTPILEILLAHNKNFLNFHSPKSGFTTKLRNVLKSWCSQIFKAWAWQHASHKTFGVDTLNRNLIF